MWNVLSVGKLIFINLSHGQLRLARPFSKSPARLALALGVVLATATVAQASPVVQTSGPNLGAASLGPNEYQLTATGGDGINYTWSLVPGFGTLPPGMAIRTDTPIWFSPLARAGLSGVATTPGIYHFRLRVTSGADFADRDYTFIISTLVVKDPYQVFDAYVGEPYAYAFTTQRNGVDVAASWTATGGAYPAGVSLGVSGVLQGTPTAPGTYDFFYSVTESGETVFKAGRVVVHAVHITSNALPAVLQNNSYSTFVGATGGSGSYRFTASGLPSGLGLNPATGAVFGTVTSNPGVFPINVTVNDTVNHSFDSKLLSIDVVGTPAALPYISPYGGTFQDVTAGLAFSQGVSVRSGGRAPFTWIATGLPPGVSIRSAIGTTGDNIAPGDAEIWGNATAPGLYNVVFTVTDADGVSTSHAFSLRVSPLQLTDYLIDGTLGSTYTRTLRVVGGEGPYSAAQINGRLPLGLSLAGATQLVSGTVGESGNFGVQFRFTDTDGHTLDLWSGLNIVGPSIVITTNDNLGIATQGVVYSTQLTACCLPVTNWSVIDPLTLPPGLSLSSSGLLSGTPSASGTYSFVVRAADPANAASFALRQFTLIVTTLQVTTSFSLPSGNVGSPYGGPSGLPLNVTGGTGPDTWTLFPGTYTPPGTILTVTGVLLGTPSSTGQYSFSVKVTDSSGRVRLASFAVSIYPAGALPPPGFNINANLGTWSIGQVDGVQLPGYGGNGIYTVGVVGPLPPGLDLRTDVPSFFAPGVPGLIGVATTPGTYSFQLSITSAGVTTVQTFTIKIVNFVVKNLFSLPDTFVGRPFSSQLIALRDGAPVPATWAAVNGLPAGVSLSSSGELHGTPAAPGFYGFTVSASDGGDTVFRFVNYAAYAVNITTSSNVIPNVPQGSFYTTPALSTVGGSGTYTYSVSGNLGGLSFNSSTGVLSGTINAGTGLFSYTITATDTSSPAQSYSKRFSVNVIGVVPVLPQVTTFGSVLRDCTIGVPCDLGINLANGGTAPFTWQVSGAPPGMDVQWDSALTSSYVNPGFAQLWGTPTALGSFNVTLTVTDATGVTASNTFPVNVSPLLMTNQMNNGTIGTPYSSGLRVIGGTRPYTATQTGGQLPNGLSVDGTGLTVSGTPLESGGFNFTVKYVDVVGNVLQVGNSGLTQIFINGGGSNGVNIFNGGNLGSIAQGFPYSQQLSGCCPSSLNWTLMSPQASLPAGVTFSASGLLNGTPTASGTYSFLVRAADPVVGANYAQRLFTITVTPLNLATITSLPFGNVGTPYAAALAVTGGTGAITWTVAPVYSLPPGLSLVPTAGGGTSIAGTPTLSGQFQFNLIVADAAGHTLTRNFTLFIFPAGGYPPLNWTPGPSFSPVGVGGVSLQLSGPTGGVQPYHYSYTPGAPVIPGVRVQDGQPLPSFFPLSVTGGLVGVATTPGVYNSSLRVTDSAGNTFDRAFSLAVSPLHILSQNNLPKATRNVSYSFTMQPYPAAGTYTWSAINLPSGLSIDPSSGVISGAPTVSGFFSPSITLRDASSNSLSLGFNLTVNPFSITTDGVLPTGTIGTAYNPPPLTTSGCGGTCSWSLFNSSLPSGLVLTPASGLISGTPTGAFNGSVTIQASGPLGAVQKIFAIRINPSAPQTLSIASGPSFGFATIGNSANAILSAQGGTPPYAWTLESGLLPTGVSILGPGDAYSSTLTPGFSYLLGRVLQAGVFNFTMRVTDNVGATTTRAMTWTVSTLSHSYTSLPVTFTNPTNIVLAPLVYGTPYTQPLLVAGGTGRYTHTLVTPLPTGLVLNAATGVISGTPINTGFFNASIQATDTAGAVVVSNISFNIASPTGNPPLTFNTGPNLGTFQLGGGLSFNITPFGGVGGPYTLTAITPLPPGFGLETGTALLSNPVGGSSYVLAGTPLAAGTFAFTIEARDTLGNVGARTFTLTVVPLALATPTNLPDASVGVFYSQPLVTWDNTSAVTWSAPSGVPPGLSLSGNVISGTPSSSGTFNFTLNATDASGAVVSFAFSLRVSNIAITDPQVLPVTAFAGVPFSYQFHATGGGASKTWSAISLPNGFSLSPDGLLTGKTGNIVGPVQTITVVVTDGGISLTRRFTFYMRTDNRAELDYPLFATTLLDAIVGQSYGTQLIPSGGTPPYAWSVAPGSLLPAGLNLVSNSTLGAPLSQNFVPGGTFLAGAAIAEGRYVFDLILTDAAGASLRRTFTLNVSSINILPGVPRSATTGASYAEQFTAVGGTPPYTFSMTPLSADQDMLPPGFTLSSSGLISGTTSSTGNYAFMLRLQDAAGRTFARPYASGNGLQLVVNSPAGLRVMNTNPSDTQAGSGVDFGLFTNGNSTYSWSLAPGSSLLPPGLVLSSDEIVGQPTAAGTYTFTLRARDDGNNALTADHTFTLRVVPMFVVAPPVKFQDNGVLPAGQVGSAYAFRFKAAGGTAPYAYSVSTFSQLPPGLALSSDGLLSGTPTSIGNYTVGLVISDAAGYVLRLPGINFVVAPSGAAAPLILTSGELFDASVGQPFSFPIDPFIHGGRPPFTFSTVSGSPLPPGMKLLTGGNGVASSFGGTPTTAGQYQFSAIVQDSSGQTVTVTLSQAVSPITLSPAKLPPGKVGTPYNVPLVASGGSGPYTIQLDPTGDLPVGLTLTSGALTGTPAIAGDYVIFAFVQDGTGNTLGRIFFMTVDDALGEAPAVTLAPNSLQVNYLQGATGGASIPVTVNTTSGARPFTAMATGIPGASVSPSNGVAAQAVTLNLDAAPLAAGTYVGAVGVNAPDAASMNDFAQIVLNVKAPGSDTTPPVIGAVSNITAEATSGLGAVVTFALPSVTDNFYPAPTVSADPASGSMFPLGDTIVTVTATDSSGLVSHTSFTVTVRDTTPPVLTLPANITTEATLPAGAAVVYTATASDLVDGPLTPTCSPATSSVFSVGVTTTVNCSVTDSHHNLATGSFSVRVVDTIAPDILITTPAPAAGYVFGTSVSASYRCVDTVGYDSCQGPVESGAPVDTSTLGPHDFTVSAIDHSGNRSSLTVRYNVIQLPSVVVTDLKAIYELGRAETVHYTCPNADVCEGEIASGGPLDTSTPGLKQFAIHASDSFGNETNQTVTYVVSLGRCDLPVPYANITAWLTGDGAADDEIGGNASWVGAAAYEPGVVGRAFSFGSGSYVTLPMTQPGSFTVQAWVRTANRMAPAGTGVLSTGVSGLEAISARIELDGAGNYVLVVGNYDPVLFIGPATESFQHIAATYDQATGSIWTYLNGQPADWNVWMGSPDLGIHVLNLGVNLSLSGTAFAGAVDEAVVIDHALTADELFRSFQTGASGFCRNRAPIAVARVPASVEANSPTTGNVLLDGRGSSDPDLDPLTYRWSEGPTTLGAGSDPTLPVALALGTHHITLTVDDGRHKQAADTVTVVVQDTQPPVFSNVPPDSFVEASSAAGGVAIWPPLSAVDGADGTVPVSCSVESGSLLPMGPTVIECSASDSRGHRAAATFTLTVRDTTPPGVVITAPANGSTFARFDSVKVFYSCGDAVAVTSCSGAVASGANLDTSVKGPHTFVVNATDSSGNAHSESISYSVVAPPTIAVRSPVVSLLELGGAANADFDCGDAMSCESTVPNGTALDTSSPGLKSFTITATDALGNTTSVLVTYSVSFGTAVTPPVPGPTAWLAGDGSASDETSSRVGTWRGTPAYDAGKVAQAFSVGGSNTVSFPIVQPGPFTIQAWVKTPNALQPYGTGVLSTGGPGQESTSAQIELDGAGNYQLNAGNGDLVTFMGPAANGFHHLAVTFDGSIVTAYFDGQAVSSDAWPGSPDLGILGLIIGNNRAATLPFTGLVDELQVFNYALAANAVRDTFLAGVSGYLKDRAPVAVASALPVNEATGPDGAMVTLVGSGSDADMDALTYTWREGDVTLGTEAVLHKQLAIGSHAITFVVDDGHFKQGLQTVVVVVQDTTPPSIDLSSVPVSFSTEATSPSGASATFTIPTATDIVDVTVNVACVPAAGGTFQVGATVVHCTATDAHLNQASAQFTVTVTDSAPPALVGVPKEITREATSADGATVSWPSPTASDLVDGNVNVTCVPASGSVFHITTTQVECTAEDTHGNRDLRRFDVVVQDTTPPAWSGVPSTLTFEATSPAGSRMTYTPPIATDLVEGVVVPTCLPASDAVLGLGEWRVVCSADDSRLNHTETSFAVRVIDSVGPALTLPGSVVAEATGPLGVAVSYVVGARDVVSGVVPISCAPASGSTFGIGLTAVTCSATDGEGNVTVGEFPVVVRDTIAPAAQIVTPSVDAVLTGSPVTVTVQAGDIVGVASVSIFGTPATLITGTPQSGVWSAAVPLTVVPGTAVELRAVVADGAGNSVDAARIVDNDGIQSQAPPAALAPFGLDRGRTSGDDLSNTFSSEFNNGITSGTVTRNGWTVTLNASTAPPRPLTVPPTAFWPSTGWVQVGVTGSAGSAEAIVGACGGRVKQIRLNAPGERGAFACDPDPATGTVAFKALSASPTIEVWKQISPTAWLSIPVMTGGGVSTGSPTTAFPDNPGPIDVQVVRFDDSGAAHVVGTFRLAPGASADVSVKADSAGRDDQFVFHALHGTVPVTMNGTLKVLEPGVAATLPIDRTPPRVSCGRADRAWHGDNVQIACTAEDRELGLGNPLDARFLLATAVADGDETSGAETDSRTVCDAGGNCADVVPVGGNRIDRKPPAIDVTTPRSDAVYVLHQAVVGSFSCADGGSGVASCAASSDNGRAIPTSSVGASTFTVVAADQVGNSHTVSIPYAVTYAVEPVEDGRAVRIVDALGVNQSAPSVQLRATGIVSFDGTLRVELTDPLRFDPRSGVYLLDQKTAGLRSGNYRLHIEVSGDPVSHVVPFRVK